MWSKFMSFNLGKYFVVSCLACFIDLALSYFLYRIAKIDYLVACNIGICTGFVFQYLVCMKYIFTHKGFLSSFTIYLGTFLLGLVIADGTIWVSFSILYLSFIISKLLSMALPFFITYFIRRLLFGVKIEESRA